MSLAKKIKVNTSYTRSINLERDADSVSVVNAYIPTTRALDTLNKVGATITNKGDVPRAWTLMGPYGSGKSSFAVFLTHLLGIEGGDATACAQHKLRESNLTTLSYFKDAQGAFEHCRVLLTGSPEPLSKRLAQALWQGAVEYFGQKSGAPDIISALKTLSEKDHIDTSEIITAVTSLQKAVALEGGDGVLIIIDELGKFLEYEARHAETNDIFLLQALAEHAYKGSKDGTLATLSLFVLLHQVFDQYARNLSKTQQNEWAKVQGRFEVLPFLENTEQTLRVVGEAIEQPKKISRVVTDRIKNTVEVLAQAKALPNKLKKLASRELFKNCYPLHPVSALLLPLLCQKVAQNERTLFNYLGSQEPHGFKDSVQQLTDFGDWIYPWDIYDYFVSNQSVAVIDHITHRRWAEVVTALERLDTEDDNAAKLLKMIGLLNIVGAQAGLKASKDILELCLDEPTMLSNLLSELRKQSIVQLRKFNNEYRVWQGSDFDLEEQLQNERGNYSLFSLADYLNQQYQSKPIVARKFTIQKGALHYFNVIFADRTSLQKLTAPQKPRIIFYLTEDDQDNAHFEQVAQVAMTPLDILVEYSRTLDLRDAVAEILALRAVESKAQQLHSDPVAQREFRDYYQMALQREAEQVAFLFEQPQLSTWFWQKRPLSIVSKRDFQTALSSVLNELYRDMPVIKNELINRNKPSSQAAAGRNKLLEMMLLNPHQEDLGIEKFPPEKAIYRAVLRETGLHRQDENGAWGFQPPKSGTTLYQAWKVVEEFLEGTRDSARTFSELGSELTSIPVGLKQGVLPILYLAAYLAYEDELALYEEGNYLPFLPKEVLERFVKTPGLFQVQLFRVEGVRASLLKQYVSALFNDDRERTVIQAIKPLTTFIKDLNDFTQKTTRNIQPSTVKFRNAFFLAKSPEQLLFEGIPAALGFDTKRFNDSQKEDYAKKLHSAIRELKYAYENMLHEQQAAIARAIQCKKSGATLDEVRKSANRYRGLQSFTVDVDGLKAFINRLTDDTKEDNEWLQDVLMFLGRKAPEKWLDSDYSNFDQRLSDFSKRLLDLEALRLQHDRNTVRQKESDFDVVLLKTVKQGAPERTQPVVINTSQRQATDQLKASLLSVLDGMDEDLKLAALAELVDETLKNYQNCSDSVKNTNCKPKQVKNG